MEAMPEFWANDVISGIFWLESQTLLSGDSGGTHVRRMYSQAWWGDFYFLPL